MIDFMLDHPWVVIGGVVLYGWSAVVAGAAFIRLAPRMRDWDSEGVGLVALCWPPIAAAILALMLLSLVGQLANRAWEVLWPKNQ